MRRTPVWTAVLLAELVLGAAVQAASCSAPDAETSSAPPASTATSPAPSGGTGDPRAGYDVGAYRIALEIDPERQRIAGTVAVEARVVADELGELVLDLSPELEVDRVAWLDGPIDGGEGLPEGRELRFRHAGERVTCSLPQAVAQGATVRVAVAYHGEPKSVDAFTGVHWRTTADGRPWIGTSCQDVGSRFWWPCKDSYFHPEDKPERLLVDLTVPEGLYAVSNGRLVAREKQGRRELFRWRHDYPLETYTVTVNVAPYVVIEQALELAGIDEPVPFIAYVLPENEEKARLQFQDVPRMLEVYGEAFGPFPFPKSKFALVETSFWGMEHSTAVAYGSSYPAWIRAHGGVDRFAGPNRFFDYILVHESAHEWWGNAVSAETWGDFWIHEGFATYAESVYVEFTQGREEADRWFETQRKSIDGRSRLYRGDGVDSGQAYAGVIYSKGAWVLNMLRHYLQDDRVWWKTLRDFNQGERYGNASTADFLAVLEKNTGGDWDRFFQEWVYGEGYPKLSGKVTAQGAKILVQVDNEGSGETGFRVPLDLFYRVNDDDEMKRVWLEPGENRLTVEADAKVEDLEVVDLHRLLGRHEIAVK